MAAAVQVPVTIGNTAANMVFKFGTLRLAEQELGRPITADLASGNVGMDILSALFWAVLQPSLRITREASDDLVDEVGVEQVASWMGDGLRRYFGGDAADAAAAGGAAPGEVKAAKKG